MSPLLRSPWHSPWRVGPNSVCETSPVNSPGGGHDAVPLAGLRTTNGSRSTHRAMYLARHRGFTRPVFFFLASFLAIAALGLTIIGMPAMHVGQSAAADSTSTSKSMPMPMPDQAAAADPAPALPVGHAIARQDMASASLVAGHATGAPSCPGPDCLMGMSGPEGAIAMLCLGLLPAAALLLLRWLGRPSILGLQHQASTPSSRSRPMTSWALPRPPSLFALCILRT